MFMSRHKTLCKVEECWENSERRGYCAVHRLLCSVPGCIRIEHAADLCMAHYQAQRRSLKSASK